MPEATPAEVNIDPSIVKITFSCMCALGADSRRKLYALQCVVAFFPSKSPAFPIRLEPVHTDAVKMDFADSFDIFWINTGLSTSLRVPHPPGITNKSKFGQSSKVKSGISLNPPIAITGVFFPIIVQLEMVMWFHIFCLHQDGSSKKLRMGRQHPKLLRR